MSRELLIPELLKLYKNGMTEGAPPRLKAGRRGISAISSIFLAQQRPKTNGHKMPENCCGEAE